MILTKFCQKLENMTILIIVEDVENWGLSNIAVACVKKSTPFVEQHLEELKICIC